MTRNESILELTTPQLTCRVILTDEQAGAVLALLFGAAGSAPGRRARGRETGVITRTRGSRNPHSELQETIRRKLLAVLADEADGLTVPQLAERIDAGHSSTYDAAMFLLRMGEVARRRNGHGFVYFVTPVAPGGDPPEEARWPQATIVAGEGVTDGSV